MLKRGYKLIISVVLVATLFIGFGSVFASADIVGGAGLLGSALGSLGVDLLAGGSATMATLAPWLNSDYSIRGILTGVADGFIKVNDDSVIIDGVEYQSIFLDPLMAAELHTQAFDFITQKAITDNSSGILASGVGYWDGLPVYSGVSWPSVSVSNSTQLVNYPLSFGSYVLGNNTTLELNPNPSISNSGYWQILYNGVELKRVPASGYVNLLGNIPIGFAISNSGSQFYNLNSDGQSGSLSTFRGASLYDSDSFTYSYVSSTIDVSPLPTNYGFSAYIPAADLSGAGIVAGTYYNDNDLAVVNQLIDLLDKAYADQVIENVEWSEETQPVPPVPDTTIADTAYADLHDEMVDIKNNQAHANTALDNIDSNIDVLGRTVDNIDSTLTDIEGKVTHAETEIVDALDTAGQSVVDGLSDVEGAIDTAGQAVVDGLSDVEGAVDTAGQSVVDSVEAQTQALEQSISDVADKVESLDTTVDEVIEKIESHPLDLFGAFLDRLTQIPVLRDLFNGIKQHVGIWHYVVEWLQCIGTFLSFFIGLFADVAYCMVVPIYACVAGAICLAFYKRFGR